MFIIEQVELQPIGTLYKYSSITEALAMVGTSLPRLEYRIVFFTYHGRPIIFLPTSTGVQYCTDTVVVHWYYM